MDLEPAGRTAIVTGARRGSGRGLGLGFSAEGCNVVLASRDEVRCREVAAAAHPTGQLVSVSGGACTF